MSRYWAKVVNNKVVDVIVASEEHIHSGLVGDPVLWIETARGGIGADRGHEAGVGFNYDPDKDIFYPDQPFPSWTLGEDYNWHPPVQPPPERGCWRWDEVTQQWLGGQEYQDC